MEEKFMKRWMAPFILLLFVVFMFGYGLWYAGAVQEENAKLPLKAEIVVYTDLPNNVSALLASQYQREQNVKVTIMPLTEEQMAQRMSADRVVQNGDVVITSKDNLLVGTEHKQFRPVVTESIDEISDCYKNIEGYWVGLWLDPVVFAQSETFYNGLGKFVTTWNTLGKPGVWRIVMTDFVASQNAANLLYNLVEEQGEEHTLTFLNNVKPHIVQHAKFLSTPVRLAALGETDIGIGNYSDGEQYVRQSYPLKIIFPVDGTSYYLTGAAVLDCSKDSRESEAFIKWLLNKETAEYLMSNNFYYVFTNPEIPNPKDSLGHSLVLWNVKGNYTGAGKKFLLNKWISQVRFRKDI